MKPVFGLRRRRDAQSFVFFIVSWGTIMLLSGLAIDSGLLYLAKARLARAVDGASLAAVGNFQLNSTSAALNRDAVAIVVRNFAAANYTDLSPILNSGVTVSGGTQGSYNLPTGGTGVSYTYNFNDGTQDPNGQFRRFVQVIFNTGSGGAITSATVNARCPAQTYFIGYGSYLINGKKPGKIGGYIGPSSLADLKVSSSAIATRRPRLIMVVIDRSGSMLQPGGGASGLPPAVVQFLDFFDTSSDNIGIVSFGSAARLEMPMTTNFIIAGTNNLTDAYQTNNQGDAIPGVDPEDTIDEPSYNDTGVRRLKFGGSTAADDGIRLAMEQLMANAGFNDPDVVKYMVIFTDGKWNAARTLVAAPGYTNEVTCPFPTNLIPPYAYFTNGGIPIVNGATVGMVNGQYTNGPQGGGPWDTNLVNDTNLIPMPSLGQNGHCLPFITNAIAFTTNGSSANFANLLSFHTNDTWQSTDATTNEPLPGQSQPSNLIGASMAVTNSTWVGSSGNANYYTHNVDVWLQPGSVAYYYTNQAAAQGGNYTAYVSNFNQPTKHINLYLWYGGKIDLVVPGYVADGVVYDGLDLTFPDNPGLGIQSFPCYRANNFQEDFMWSDDTVYTGAGEPNGGYVSASLQRQLMFRNYLNLLTGFYVSRPDYPLGTSVEPLITDAPAPGSLRPRDPLGPYYPGAAFYWPFGGETNSVTGAVTNAVGLDYSPNFALIEPLSDPDPNDNGSGGWFGGSRHFAYSVNMLSPSAAPEWAGELFYKSTSGGGTNVVSGNGTTSASQIMVSGDWQVGAPTFMAPFSSTTGIMTSDSTHNTSITPNPSVWRPASFNGSIFGNVGTATLGGSATGGFVSDGNGNVYKNAMAWSGRPTHYFDFSQSKWVPIANNHTQNVQFLPLGIWKAQEYAWHARALGVTIYTVGYGGLVYPAQQVLLAQIANSTNTTAGNSQSIDSNGRVVNYVPGPGTGITYNPGQPIGAQYYATNSADISNDFYSIGQAINAALTQ